MNAPHDKAPPASSYGLHRVLQPRSFAQGVALVTEALKAEGFGILTGIDGRPSRILGAGARTWMRLVVGFMDPAAVLQMTSKPEVARVAHRVRDRLERVRPTLGGTVC